MSSARASSSPGNSALASFYAQQHQVNESGPDLSHGGSAMDQQETFVPAVKPRSTQDVLNALDERYMTEDFDPVKELFNNLPEGDESLSTHLRELELASSTIDKKLSSQVFKNYHHFVAGLALITDISGELKASRNLCAHGREELRTVDEELTHAVFATLRKKRSMARCNLVILRLHEIYDLLRRENQINALLKRDEFIESVHIYRNCLVKLAQSGLSKFTCLDALRARFLRTAELISTQVKGRLLSLAKCFEPNAFRNLIQAMVNLGDYKVLAEYLRKFVGVAMEENACEAITPFLSREYIQSLMSMQASQGLAKAIDAANNNPEQRGNGVAPSPSPVASEASQLPSPVPSSLSSPVDVASPSSLTSADIASLPRKPFKDLCTHLDRSQFSLAFLTLASKLMDNLYAVQSMFAILAEIAEDERKKGEDAMTSSVIIAAPPAPTVAASSDDSVDGPAPLSEAESISLALDNALQYLRESRASLWSRICSICTEFFRNNYVSVAHVSVDDFVRVLKNGQDLIDIGEAFVRGGARSGEDKLATLDAASSSDASPSLRTVLSEKSADYVRNFLHESLTTLSSAFETESFRPLPVEADFTSDSLKEFRVLHSHMARERRRQSIEAAPTATVPSSDLWEAFLNGSNPFARAILEQKNEYEVLAQESAQEEERVASAEAARVAASARPALRTPGSGPVRASALNLSVGRPNFVLPTTGGMTGGVPTVQPRRLALAQAAAAASAAQAAPVVVNGTPAALSPSTVAALAGEPARPFVLSSSLALTKIVGKYLSLFRSFPSQGCDALVGLQDCVEFFAYTFVMTFGVGQQGFFALPGGSPTSASSSAHSALSELNASLTSPSFLVDTYPALRALLVSVKNRVELGSFGGGSGAAGGRAWAREWEQDDVIAAAATLAQAQAAWNEVQQNGHTALTGSSPLISPSSGAPQTLAAVASAQAAAVTALNKEKDSDRNSFFSKLKKELKIGPNQADRDRERRERESFSVANSASATSLHAVTTAANYLAATSAAHLPPQLVTLSTKILRDLDTSDQLHGIVHRMHAIEGLGFVFQLLGQHMDLIVKLLPQTPAAAKRAHLFRTYIASIARELQSYLHGCCAPIMLPKESFLSKLNQCRWDSKELQTNFNAYVDTVINTLRVNEMSLQSAGGLPPALLKHLWTALLQHLASHLVDAYSKAKKCTTEGRGLMALDLSALRSGLEKITGLKPLPHFDFVVSWVSAYYLPDSEFLAWVGAHPEYTMAQVISVAQCGCGASMTSKERLQLIGSVTDLHNASVARARQERDSARKPPALAGVPEEAAAAPAPAASTPVAAEAASSSRPPSTSHSRALTPSASSDQLDQLASPEISPHGSDHSHEVLDQVPHAEEDLP